MAGHTFGGGVKRMQEQFGNLEGVLNPLGDILFVDSSNGRDGDNGQSPRRALLTLARALVLANNGDNIVLLPGGSETLTTGLTCANTNINIVCPVASPNAGYELTGAGTVDLLTITGADCLVKGLRFTRGVLGGSTKGGIVTSATADRLAVENCAFDYNTLTSAWTNYGIEINGACDGVRINNCYFRDCHRGVEWTLGSGDQIDTVISNCRFVVGRATAFGIHANVAGDVFGLTVRDCEFIEGDGDGTAATDSWDGTSWGATGASGPIKLGATTDQFILTRNVAYATTDYSFAALCAT